MLTALSRPLNSVGMPYYHDTLLSAWPTHLISDIGAPPARYDQTYLDSLQSWEYGLFGRNTRPTRRGQAEDTRSSGKLANSIQAPKFLSDKSRETSSDTGAAPALGDGDATDPRAVAELESLKPDAPSMYQRVEIKFSKFGVDDFDFGCVPRADSRPGRMLMSSPGSTTRPPMPVWRTTLRTRMRIHFCRCCIIRLSYGTWPSAMPRAPVWMSTACSAS